MTNYRKLYNQAKSKLAQNHNEELHNIMKELGYVKKERILKAKDAKEIIKKVDEAITKQVIVKK